MFSSPFDNFMFSAIPIVVITFFIIITGVIIFSVGRGIRENARNNSTEEVTVPARVITKRTHVWGGQGNTSAHTRYYITFEDENGERAEYSVSSSTYSMLAEGDIGMLTHQGTRFKHFERDRF